MIKVKDLLSQRPEDFHGETIQSPLIALSGADGKVLFDTRRHSKEYIEKYMDEEVIALWASVKTKEQYYQCHMLPVLKCYLYIDVATDCVREE